MPTWSSEFSQTAANASYWNNLGGGLWGIKYALFNDLFSAFDNGWQAPMNCGAQNLGNVGNVALAAAKTISVPGQPRLYTTVNSAQSVPNNTFTALSFTVDALNVGGMHSTTINPQNITIQQSGLYLLSGVATFQPNANGFRSVQWQVSGVFLNQTTIPTVNGNVCGVSAPTTIVQLTTGQTVQMQVYQSSGAALAMQPNYSYASVYLLA